MSIEEHFGQVRVQTLPPLHMAGVEIVSETPEHDCFALMDDWVSGQGPLPAMRTFGFDTEPAPEQAQQHLRGYAVYVTVPPATPESSQVQRRDFPGGLYAVLPVADAFSDPFTVIPAAWAHLQEWLGASDQYRLGDHQWFEEHVQTPDGIRLDLYAPIQPVGSRDD